MRIVSNNEEYQEYVNLATVNSSCNEHDTEMLKDFIRTEYFNFNHPCISKLNSVTSTPDRTRNSIISTTASVLAEFADFDSLMRMHSHSSFNIREAYVKPMAVFIVLPNETNAFNGIAGQVIDSIYAQLIDVFTKNYLDSAPSRRIDFICDEFCNLRINDMYSKISAARSRNVRWFIVIQSLNQLKLVYPHEWSTIIGNCKNVFFLQSSDPELREYISDLAGKTTVSALPDGEPLLSAEQLKELKKEQQYKEAIYIRDNLVYRASLPDIDTYDVLVKKTQRNSKHNLQKSRAACD